MIAPNTFPIKTGIIAEFVTYPIPNTKADGLPTKFATHSSNSACSIVVPAYMTWPIYAKYKKYDSQTQYPHKRRYILKAEKAPPSTRGLQVLAENCFNDSIT